MRSDEDLLAALNEVGLPAARDFLDRTVGDRGRILSGGQRLLVVLARALLSDAPFWILDEPAAALAPAAARDFVETARRLARTRTPLMVTHDPVRGLAGNRPVSLTRQTAR